MKPVPYQSGYRSRSTQHKHPKIFDVYRLQQFFPGWNIQCSLIPGLVPASLPLLPETLCPSWYLKPPSAGTFLQLHGYPDVEVWGREEGRGVKCNCGRCWKSLGRCCCILGCAGKGLWGYGDLQRVAELGAGCRAALPTTGGLVMLGLPGVQVRCWDRPSERPGTAPELNNFGIWEAEVQLPALQWAAWGPWAGNLISLCLGLLSVEYRK